MTKGDFSSAERARTADVVEGILLTLEYPGFENDVEWIKKNVEVQVKSIAANIRKGTTPPAWPAASAKAQEPASVEEWETIKQGAFQDGNIPRWGDFQPPWDACIERVALPEREARLRAEADAKHWADRWNEAFQVTQKVEAERDRENARADALEAYAHASDKMREYCPSCDKGDEQARCNCFEALAEFNKAEAELAKLKQKP